MLQVIVRFTLLELAFHSTCIRPALRTHNGYRPHLTVSTPIDDLAADLNELANIFAEKGFRVAYESQC